MFEYKETLRIMTDYEESLITTAIYSINLNPKDEFIVYCDTSNPLCIPFVATLIKRIKENCRGINGCILFEDKIVFGGHKR